MVSASGGPLSASLGEGDALCCANATEAIPKTKMGVSQALIFMVLSFPYASGSGATRQKAA
jgi:hypothetical protein